MPVAVLQPCLEAKTEQDATAMGGPSGPHMQSVQEGMWQLGFCKKCHT
jgi:hypothetical protein